MFIDRPVISLLLLPFCYYSYVASKTHRLKRLVAQPLINLLFWSVSNIYLLMSFNRLSVILFCRNKLKLKCVWSHVNPMWSYSVLFISYEKLLRQHLDKNRRVNCSVKPEHPPRSHLRVRILSSIRVTANQIWDSSQTWEKELSLKHITVVAQTEGGGEGQAGVSVHIRGSCGGLQGSQRHPAGFWSAAEEQPPSSGQAPRLCPPPAGPTHSLHITLDTFYQQYQQQ